MEKITKKHVIILIIWLLLLFSSQIQKEIEGKIKSYKEAKDYKERVIETKKFVEKQKIEINKNFENLPEWIELPNINNFPDRNWAILWPGDVYTDPTNAEMFEYQEDGKRKFIWIDHLLENELAAKRYENNKFR